MPNSIFYTTTIAFTSGIFVRSFFDVGVWEVLLVALMGFGCGAAWRTKSLGRRAPLFLSALALFAFALGIFRLDVTDRTLPPLESRIGEQIELEGVVEREPDMRANAQHLYVHDDVTGELVLVSTDRFLHVAYGDRVRVVGELKAPEAFSTDTGRTFNYPGYLKARGVSHMISFGKVEVLENGAGSIVLAKLFEGKQIFMHALEQHIPEPEAGLGEGVLLGVKRALGDDLEAVFRDVGIIHIVVLSGYNIMIVVETVMRMLSFVFRPRMRLLVGIAVIVSFVLLVGLSASVVRAGIMAALVIVARTIGRTYAIMRALMLAGVGMIVMNPYLLAFDPGFQLSFLATLGLVLVSPLMERWFVRVPSRFGIREVLIATCATQLTVLPLLLYQMGALSVVSILVNVLVLPIVPFAMLFTFLTGLCGLVLSPLGMLMGFSAYGLLTYVVHVAQAFASLPFAAVSVPAFPFWIVTLLYGALTLWLVKVSRSFDEDDIAINRDSTNTETLAALDEYDDWTIVEETENPRETQRVSRGSDPLPFR